MFNTFCYFDFDFDSFFLKQHASRKKTYCGVNKESNFHIAMPLVNDQNRSQYAKITLTSPKSLGI
jgi:hypothetical protein